MFTWLSTQVDLNLRRCLALDYNQIHPVTFLFAIVFKMLNENVGNNPLETYARVCVCDSRR